MAIRDTRMVAQAIEQRWNIKPEYREVTIRQIVNAIVEPSSKPREVFAACKALIAAEAQNAYDDHNPNGPTRFVAIAQELGITLISSKRWPTKPEYRDAMVRRLVGIIASPRTTKRDMVTASRILIAAEAQNAYDDHSTVKPGGVGVLDVARRLGITNGTPRISEARPILDTSAVDNGTGHVVIEARHEAIDEGSDRHHDGEERLGIGSDAT